jgi:probable aminopeptidase NPEPL1
MRESLKLISMPDDHQAYDHVIIAGPKQKLESYIELSWNEEESVLHFDAPLETLNNEDKGGATQTFVYGQRVTLIAIPTLASRMNSPSRPDALSAALKKLGSLEGRCLIILCPKSIEDRSPLISAVARSYPLFSLKSGPLADVIELTVCNGDALEDERREGPNSEEIDHLDALIKGVQHAAMWVDLPPEQLHVPQMIDYAREIAVRSNAEIDIFEGDSLMQMGMGGLWSVGRAALHPPALVVLQGPKSAPDAPQMVWVGKGIMYDTGGLSLKPKTGMAGMKMDMGGAAAVLAAFEVAAAHGDHTDLCAVLCLAENAIGHRAIRNDDIITLYSEKTVEINNTDAEGRLVLGDGVAYAVKHLLPEVIVDMATLTGAQLVATGRRHAAIICNDDTLESTAVLLGRQTGDLVHPLLYCPELLKSEFKSEVADMKNSVRDRMNAQSSCAGHFVESHLGEYKGRWLHVDIAGPAFLSERGTGFGVGLLCGLSHRWSEGTL